MQQDEDPTRAAIEQLIAAVGEEDARLILCEVGTPAARAELERVIARRLAMKLLRKNAPRSAIRDRLVAEGLSDRSAWRRIEEALGMGPRDCANPPPEVAHGVAIIPSTAPLEPPCP